MPIALVLEAQWTPKGTRVAKQAPVPYDRSMASARLSYATGTDPFYVALRARVRGYLAVPGRTRWGRRAMWLKSLTLLALLVALGAAIYSDRLSGAPLVVAFVAWQFTQFLMTIGIAHDATHGAYSRSKRINGWIVKVFDLFGIDSKHWIETHIDSHHAMPNVPLRDSAIESFALVRLHPRTRASSLSRHQHRYMFLVYSLVTMFQVYLLEPVLVSFLSACSWNAGTLSGRE
jgi:linoleoyl-CoA desaturase